MTFFPAFAISDKDMTLGNITDIVLSWIPKDLSGILMIVIVIIGIIIAIATRSIRPLVQSLIIAIFAKGLVDILKLFFSAS